SMRRPRRHGSRRRPYRLRLHRLRLHPRPHPARRARSSARSATPRPASGHARAGETRRRTSRPVSQRSGTASTGFAIPAGPSVTRSCPRSASSRRPSAASTRPAAERLLRPAALLVGLDEDVDLVGALVALLVRHGEGRRVLADLRVGVVRVLLTAVRPVPEVPVIRERPAAFLLDGRRELHL